MQSFLYVIPALILAFSLTFVILSELSDFFHAKYKIQLERLPSIESSIQAIAIGTIIPVLSSLMPILTALKLSLPDSLDNLKSKTKAMYVSVL